MRRLNIIIEGELRVHTLMLFEFVALVCRIQATLIGHLRLVKSEMRPNQSKDRLCVATQPDLLD